MRPLALLFCLIFPLAAQAGLLKCADGKGNVTYTNLPCAKIGLKEAAVIPPPPPPVRDRPARAQEAPRPAAAERPPAAPRPQDTTSPQLMKSMQAGDDPCAKLDSAMGRILDEMDAARRKGRNDSNATWNENLKKLQADKKRLGCF